MTTLVPTVPAPSLPVTPRVAPQLVACGKRDFYRITDGALQVFEIAPVVPPPHIRGSKVARQTAETVVEAPHNVVSLGAGRALAVAKGGVVQFDLAGARTRRHGGLAVEPPLFAWADARRPDAFWWHDPRARKLSRYTIPASKGDTTLQAGADVVLDQTVELVDFDGRLFTVLGNGTPMYSTPKELRRTGPAGVSAPKTTSPSEAVVLFPDASAERHWTGDAAGKLTLWNGEQSQKVNTAEVPGVVLDADTEGTLVAVLSLELKGQSYRPTVTIFESGAERARLQVGDSSTSGGLPRLDLCLVAERTWIAVGGRHWLQLLDWESRRLLAEW